MQIEKRRRLVEKEYVCLLSQHHRNPGELLLAATELSERYVPEVVDIGKRERPVDGLPVGIRRPLEEAAVGVAAVIRQVCDR